MATHKQTRTFVGNRRWRPPEGYRLLDLLRALQSLLKDPHRAWECANKSCTDCFSMTQLFREDRDRFYTKARTVYAREDEQNMELR